MIKKPTILWLIILVVGLGLVVFSFAFRDSGPVSDAQPTPDQNLMASPTAKPTNEASISPSPIASYPNIINKYPPAECSLVGSIEYIKPNLYESKGAKINYKNVDSKARHIIWSIFPKDELSVGPNLFARLPVPDGTEDVSVSLPANPIAKNYILIAQITYGVFVKGNQEIKTVSCSGSIPVSLKY